MNLPEYIGLTIFAISYVVGFLLVIRDGILLLIPAIKCRKVRGCKKDSCPFRVGCRHIAYSDKEKADIQARIDKLK